MKRVIISKSFAEENSFSLPVGELFQGKLDFWDDFENNGWYVGTREWLYEFFLLRLDENYFEKSLQLVNDAIKTVAYLRRLPLNAGVSSFGKGILRSYVGVDHLKTSVLFIKFSLGYQNSVGSISENTEGITEKDLITFHNHSISTRKYSVGLYLQIYELESSDDFENAITNMFPNLSVTLPSFGSFPFSLFYSFSEGKTFTIEFSYQPKLSKYDTMYWLLQDIDLKEGFEFTEKEYIAEFLEEGETKSISRVQKILPEQIHSPPSDGGFKYIQYSHLKIPTSVPLKVPSEFVPLFLKEYERWKRDIEARIEYTKANY